MKLKKIFLILLLVFINFQISAVESRPPEVIDWSTVDLENDGNLFDDIQNGISNALFGVVSNRIGYDGWLFEDKASIGFKISRKIYANGGADESYTVIDSFQLPIHVPIKMVTLGNENFSLSMGLNFSANALNIRQVIPDDYPKLPTVEELERKGKKIVKDAKKISPDPPEEEASGIENDWDSNEPLVLRRDKPPRKKKKRRYFVHDALMKARYSKIWNLITQPFRLPLGKKSVKRMEVGEISAYDLSGYISVSANVGFKAPVIDPIFLGNAFSPASLGISIGTYIKGNFRVSIYKESEDQVLVKVTRKKAVGLNFSAGVGSEAYRPLEGVVILESALSLEVIPFRVSVSKEWAKQFDIGYRFDLKNPEAIQAYLKAVKGNLREAEDLMIEKNGVERFYTAETTSESLNFNHYFKLAILFNGSRGMTSNFTEARITLPDGQRHVFKAWNRAYRTFSHIGGSESEDQSFLVTYEDEELRDRNGGGKDLLTLRIRGSYRDTMTSGPELVHYISKLQKLIGNRFTFPKVPKSEPRKKCLKYRVRERRILRRIGRNTDVLTRAGHFGSGEIDLDEIEDEDLDEGERFDDGDENPRGSRALQRICQASIKRVNYRDSSFYYRLGFKKKQVQKFIDYPEEKMWGILEKAFDVKTGRWSTHNKRVRYGFRNIFQTFLNAPAFLLSGETIKSGSNLFSAKIFHSKWKKLKNNKGPKELTKAFSKLFRTTFYGYEFVRIIKEVLRGEKYLLSLTAVNEDTFGNINIVDDNFRETDLLEDRVRDIIEYDRDQRRDNVDELAVIDDFRLGRRGRDEVVLGFKLRKVPKFLFVKVFRTTPLKSKKNYVKQVFNNKNGLFQKGENTFVIKRGETEGFKGRIAEFLFDEKDRVNLSLSISNSGTEWGYLADKRLKKLKKLKKPRRTRRTPRTPI